MVKFGLFLIAAMPMLVSADQYWWSCIYACSPSAWNGLNKGVCKFGEAPCPAPDSDYVINTLCWGSPTLDPPSYAEELPFQTYNDCNSYASMAKDFHMASRKQDWDTFLNSETYNDGRRLEDQEIDEEPASSMVLAVSEKNSAVSTNRRRLGWFSSTLDWCKKHKLIVKIAVKALSYAAGVACGALSGGTLAAACKTGSSLLFRGLGWAARRYGRLLSEIPFQLNELPPPNNSCSDNVTIVRDQLIASISTAEGLELIHSGYPVEMRDTYANILREQQVQDEAAIRQLQNNEHNLLIGVSIIAGVLGCVVITLVIVSLKGKSRARQLSMRIGALELQDVTKENGKNKLIHQGTESAHQI